MHEKSREKRGKFFAGPGRIAWYPRPIHTPNPNPPDKMRPCPSTLPAVCNDTHPYVCLSGRHVNHCAEDRETFQNDPQCVTFCKRPIPIVLPPKARLEADTDSDSDADSDPDTDTDPDVAAISFLNQKPRRSRYDNDMPNCQEPNYPFGIKETQCPKNFSAVCAANVPYQCLSGKAMLQCAASPEYWDNSEDCDAYCNIYETHTHINRNIRRIRITNATEQHLWIGVFAETPMLDKTGFSLQPSTSRTLIVPTDWSGMIWARTNCQHSITTDTLTCEVGDCNGMIECETEPSDAVTVAKFDLNPKGTDVYQVDISRGYNLGMGIKPVIGTYQRPTDADVDADVNCALALCQACDETVQYQCMLSDYQLTFYVP